MRLASHETNNLTPDAQPRLVNKLPHDLLIKVSAAFVQAIVSIYLGNTKMSRGPRFLALFNNVLKITLRAWNEPINYIAFFLRLSC